VLLPEVGAARRNGLTAALISTELDEPKSPLRRATKGAAGGDAAGGEGKVEEPLLPICRVLSRWG